MTNGDHASQIYRVALRDHSEMVRSTGDVFEGTRPSAALVSDAAILKIPCRNARRCKIGTKAAQQSEIVLCLVATAMNDDDHRKRPIVSR